MAKFRAFVERTSIAEAQMRLDTEHAAQYPEDKRKGKSKTTKAFPYTVEQVLERVDTLLTTPDKLNWLKQECLWTEETIKKYDIGYDENEAAYWIPVKENGIYQNIRKYRPTADKKYSSIKGCGDKAIYMSENLEHGEIYMMEGEKDCVLANQLGLNAISVTGGAGSFDNSWKPFFVDKHVIICYDIDEAGTSGAAKIADIIALVSRSVRNVLLDITEPPNGDFTDYIKSGKSIQDFLALVAKTPRTEKSSPAPVDIPDEVVDSPLDMVDTSKLFYRRVKMNVRVIAKETAPYLAMQQASVSCLHDNGSGCNTCRVGESGDKGTVQINETTPRLLDLIECSTNDKYALIRDIFYMSPCRKFILKETGHQAIHKVSIIPSIDEIKYDDDTYNQQYVERELYFIGDRLEANNDYQIEAVAVPSPKDQSLVLVGYKAQPADSSIEEFTMTPELKRELEIFQCHLETK